MQNRQEKIFQPIVPLRRMTQSCVYKLPLLGVIENEFDAVAVAVVDLTGVILFVFIVVEYGV